MKKLVFLFLLLMGVKGMTRADFFSGNIQDKSFTLHFSSAVPTGTTAANWVLVDLSSTTVFPHTETGFAGVASARVVVDKLAATTATVKLGVVTRVNLSSGSVSWFYSSDQANNVSNTNSLMDSNPSECVYKLKVSGATPDLNSATTPYLMTSDKTTDSTVYGSTTTLPSTFSSGSPIVAPAVGDIILNLSKASGAATVTVDLQYYTDRR